MFSQKNLVAIIGMAGIFPKAKNLQEYWQNILGGVDCITDVPPSRWNIEDYYDPNPQTPDKTYCYRGGFIPDIEFNPLELGMPPSILEVTDVAQMLSLVVAKQALEDAGYGNAERSIRQRTGVVLGIGGGQKLVTPLTARLEYPVWEKILKSSGLSEADTEKIIEKIKLAYIPWEENSFPGMLGNVVAGRIANRLDLGGMNCVVDAACASSLSALRMALSELTECRSDMMILGGVDTDNTIFMYMCFSKTPAFSRKGQIRPFDAEADGMLIGEGLGMLVLKRLADAERDGDRIYAVIKGMGSSSDGKYKSIYAPRSSGQALALRRAYEDANVEPQTVGLIEAHGTGTTAGDPTEFSSLNEVFGENNPKKQHIALGSIKSQIGHTKSAAGVASLIKVALGLHHKILPPTINVSQPHPKLKIEESAFYINTKTRPWIPTNQEIPRRAGVSAFGFGGTNFHIVLEEYQKENNQPYRLHKTIDSILIAAQTPEKLLTRCQSLKEKLKSERGEIFYQELIKSSQTLKIPRLAARVGFVALSLAETIKLLEIAINYLKDNLTQAAWEHPPGIYYRKTGINPQGKVVALFSGQGSEYLEMGKELTINFPQMRQAYSLMDSVLIKDNLAPISQVVFPKPTFVKAEKDEQITTLNKTENAQPAIGALSMGLYKILEQAGFKSDFFAGHSFGELTALWAAKVLSDEDYCFLVKSRGQAMTAPSEANFDAGKMLAVIGDLTNLQAAIQNYQDVTIANYNSHNQVVLAGTSLAILEIKEKLGKLGFTVVLLPVSAAFHTSLVSHAQKPFVQALKKVRFNSPQVPVYSNTTANLYSQNPDEIQQCLSHQILNPVRFQEEIENIYHAGGYFFIEFGPQNILTKLVNNILADKPHLAVALNGSRKKNNSRIGDGCDRQFQTGIVQLRVAGLNLSNIDAYQIDQKLPEQKTKKGLTVNLNGANYVSEKTKNAFEKALTDGHKIKSLNQRQTENDKIVRTSLNQKKLENIQEKTSFCNDNISLNQLPQNSQSIQKEQKQTNMTQSDINHQTSSESFERIMMRFYDHQAEVLKVHEQYLKSQRESAQGFFQIMEQKYSQLTEVNGAASVIENKIPATGLPNFVINQSVLKEQETSNNQQTQQINHHDGTSMIAVSSLENPVTSPTSSQQVKASPAIAAENPISQIDNRETGTEVIKNGSISQPELNGLTQSLLEVVSEKTGYPAEMLELEMDIEADLGIDSIKRVEIMGAMQELYPDMPPVNPEELAELRTLVQIVNYMGKESSSPLVKVSQPITQIDNQETETTVIENQSISPVKLKKLTQSLLEVVSEKTGYPAEMLELEMDIEADLGIDSIKRVEIMGAMQELYPDMPPVNPEELAELRTLVQIVNYMGKESSGELEKKTLVQV